MQALRLNWPKCRQGYEVLELRRSVVDWPPLPAGRVFELPPHPRAVKPPADATAAEQRLLARRGTLLSPNPDVPKELEAIARVIEPRSDRTHVVNVLATAPDLFVEFANIDYSEARLLAFFDKHGPLYHSGPMLVLSCLAWAARFQKVLSQFETDKKTGSKRWLSSFERVRPRVFEIESGDLKVVPTMNSGDIQVWLEPPDLLSAIWLQFLLKVADDMALIHCHSCSNFIAAAGSLGRTDKRFCSAACKQRDYRRREAEKSAGRAVGGGAGRITKRRLSK